MITETVPTTVTYYGHSCFMVEVMGVKLLFDPFITPNPLAKDIDISTVDPDYILVTHAHSDHIADVEPIARQSGAVIVSNFEITSWFESKGLDKVHPLNHGGSLTLSNNMHIKYVNAVHTSSFPDGSYGGQPGGFLVNYDDTKGGFYYSGDTALSYDMKLIGEAKCIHFAFLCIGDTFTMGVDDAIRAAEFVGVHDVIGMHYDTFPPIEIDHEAAVKKFYDSGNSLKLPKIGEAFSI